MKLIIFITICAAIWILVLILFKPKVHKMNRSEKTIFKNAMKKIQRNGNKPRIIP
ncbi:MAG TPA: hypothetical protein VMV77_06140 [Bacteroidales bacterium]|nr:hypothetical protein [Bacteroidales bacterium]